MNNDKQQSQSEIDVAEVFFSYLQNELNSKYKAVPLPNTIQGIDVMGVSNSKEHEDLAIEVTEAKKRPPEGEGLAKGIELFDCDQVIESINKKIKKYSGKIKVSDVILLVHGLLGREWMNDMINELQTKNISAPFRGIYYIYKGDTDNDAFILEIKNAFD